MSRRPAPASSPELDPLRRRSRLAFIAAALACVAALAIAPGSAVAQDEEEYEPPAGLLAEYSSDDGRACRRIDESIAFDWETASPDERVGTRFRATWTGKLFVLTPDSYRLHAYGVGRVSITLGGKNLVTATLDEPGWKASEPIPLPYGEHALRIEFEKTAPTAALGLYWSGEKFALEPVPSRSLVSAETEDDLSSFAAGRTLVNALRCGACHALPDARTPAAAPSLVHARGNLAANWLRDWLADQGEKPRDAADADAASSDDESPDAGASLTAIRRRMPHFALADDEIAALTAYVARRREPTVRGATSDGVDSGKAARDAAKSNDGEAKKDGKDRPPAPSVALGRKAFLTLGCTACHTAEGIGTLGPFGGGDLSTIGEKRPRAWFADWLATPAKLNPDHRMPTFALAPHERESLAMYLSERKRPGAAKAVAFEPASGDHALVARGESLWKERRCHACHREEQTPLDKRAFPRLDAATPGCLGAPDASANRPGYALSTDQSKAVREYLAALAGRERIERSTIDAGAAVLETQNCLSCHARGELKGLAPQVAAVAKAETTLAADAAGLVPPALHGIGDKLHEEYMRKAVAGEQPRLRPWLSIRMPVFSLSDADRAALAAYFVKSDRIPDRPSPFAPREDDPAIAKGARELAGGRLTTADGFGCTSCHQIGSAIPHKVALNAHGTNLTALGERIRRPWYDRWVRNPARIVPQMEMPAVKLPVHGVLKDDLDAQLSAIWEALNTPGFEPPKPNPVRVVRNSGLSKPGERSRVLMNAVTVDKRSFVKPFVLGLTNRANLLYDFEHARLAGWWLGDAARQRTEGKSWYWEPGAPSRWPLATGKPELLSSPAWGPVREPIARGQFLTELDAYEHQQERLTLRYRLTYGEAETWSIAETSSPADADGRRGFRRAIAVEGVPSAVQAVLRFDVGSPLASSDDGRTLRVGETGTDAIRIDGPEGPKWTVAKDGRSATLTLAKDPQRAGVHSCVLVYSTDLPGDVFPNPPALPPALTEAPFEVAPGWRAQTLPITDQIMPTGLDWRDDGALVVSSLRGEVWTFRDTDGDGLEDSGERFSDELAAPYGVAARPGDQAIDVITKDALFRLTDDDRDGRADRVERLVSGWGRTLDYHDWVVGLPRDSQGRYYLAVPCHQDKRTPEAARHHGKLLRLTPGASTDPAKSYSIEEICGGLRFAMGLAIDERDRVFASDNQGNYNPFNELNHLVAGARYGFVNESEKGQTLPDPSPPAIALPHPWTRSVNGICFLTARSDGRAAAAPDPFGPFRGHLIGCEYDTRRLVRMSLEEVGGVVQGACYPFGETPVGDRPGLQGPVACAVSPRGEIYVGSMRDSGWGAGTNVGSITKISRVDPLPAGIAEIRVAPRGFTIHFTAPVAEQLAADAKRYRVSSFRRISTPAYGGPDVDRRNEKIERIDVAPDRRSASLTLGELRTGFVYEFQLQSLAPRDAAFYPAEAYYTLLAKPTGDATAAAETSR